MEPYGPMELVNYFLIIEWNLKVIIIENIKRYLAVPRFGKLELIEVRKYENKRGSIKVITNYYWYGKCNKWIK